jgi:hypothetical protein
VPGFAGGPITGGPGGSGGPGQAGPGGVAPGYPPPVYPPPPPPPAGPGWVGPATGTGTAKGGLPPIIIIILGGIGTIIGIILVGGILIFTGAPQPCAARDIQYSAAASQQLRAQWLAIAKTGGTVNFTETQATSRGVDYVNEKGAPVEDLQVYFCPQGYAEASGKVKVLGMKSKVVVRGTLDLSGPQPQIDIQSVRAGNLPSAAARPVVNAILNAGNFKTLDINERITQLQYTDGGVAVTVTR